MATSDTVVGIIGAVILTGAMVAVFYYENQAGTEGPGDVIGTGADSFTFVYQETQGTAQAPNGGTTYQDHQADSLAEGDTRSHDFHVPAYAYNVTATITWEDDDENVGPLASGSDGFSIELVSPKGNVYGPEEGSAGSLEVYHFHAVAADVTPPQETVIVRADDEAGAREALAASTADAHGVGTWTFNVTMVSAGNADNVPEALRDTGNPYTITIQYEYWEPVLEVSGDGTTGTNVQLPAPEGGVEARDETPTHA